MRAGCLFLVLLAAKTMALPAGVLGSSIWAPVAYYQSDVLIAVVAAVLDTLCGRPRLGWVVYTAAVALVAIDVPVTLVLGSPLTMSMMRAARGPLAGSIGYYVTWDMVVRTASIAFIGLLLPIVLTRVSRRRMPA